MLSKLFFRPVQVPNEGLKGIKFPEQIFGSAWSVTGRIKIWKQGSPTGLGFCKSRHKNSWGLEGLRQTVASTYKTTHVGGGGGGDLHRQILSFTIRDFVGFVRPIIPDQWEVWGRCCPITRTRYGKNQPSFNNHINTCDDSDEGHEPEGEVGLNG